VNCHRHAEAVAVAVCVNCGRAVCPQCIVEAPGTVVVCSQACAVQTTRDRETLELVARKTLRSNWANAWFLWLAGGIFVLAGVLGAISGDVFLGLFPTVLGAIFFLAGFWFRKVSRRDS
jgi:hypothetical protein